MGRAGTSKEAKNAAAGAQQKSNARKGANGVLLKKFESVMQDMFSITSTTTTSDNKEICQEALQHLTPRYSKLPPYMNDTEQQYLIENAKKYWENIGLARSDISDNEASPWPFDSETALPQCGCVRGDDSSKKKLKKTKTGKDTGGVGDVHNNERAWRKELQLASMIQCVLAMLPDHIRHPDVTNGNSSDSFTDPRRTFRIVDFAGGTGHLAVPLALLLPHCEVVCVDLKKWSLDLLHCRVDGTLNNDEQMKIKQENLHKLPCQSTSELKRSETLPNLYTYHGSIQTYAEDFNIGVSLHACGEASDWVLRKCLDQKASWVVCSCCCGKLRSAAANPYVYQSTGGNEKEIHYPQSNVFASLGRQSNTALSCAGDNIQQMTAQMFDEVARASDYSELGDIRKPKNACRRAAKALVEWDRLLYAKECMECNSSSTESNTVLTRMVPWEASPKNDILLGWPNLSYNPYRQQCVTNPDEDNSCDGDFQVALHHLFGKNNVGTDAHTIDNNELTIATKDQNDWTAQEEADIKAQIEEFFTTSQENANDKDTVMKFPTGMGPRKRKLIHYIAESMGMRHWGEGKKDSEKIVLVALRQK